MKAWVLHDIGDFRCEEVERPRICDNEVLVAVKAVGICGSDIPRVYRDGAHRMPLIIGHEFSGQVVEAGEKVEREWIGKRVGVFPLIPCRECTPCRHSQYEMCRNYSYLGSRCDGGFAEYVAVPEWNLIELPDSVSFEEAAMLEPMSVAVHAMRRVMPSKEDTVVVCGLGTIGTLLVMFLLDAGVKNLFVIGNKEFQRQTMLQMGIANECYCDSRTSDIGKWISEHTNGAGADVFFECVGRNETVVQAIDSTAPAGKICMVGNPYSNMELDKNTYWKILRNQLTVTGTWNSSFVHSVEDDWHYVLDRLEQGKISPSKLISHRFPLEDIEKGFQIMRDKSEDYIKAMAEFPRPCPTKDFTVLPDSIKNKESQFYIER